MALEGAVEDFLQWISTSPARDKVEIFVPSARMPQGRRLQLKLQSLGCTVKRRVQYAA